MSVNKVGSGPRVAKAEPASEAKAPAPAERAPETGGPWTAAPATHRAKSLFSGIADDVRKSIHRLEARLEQSRVDGKDGFVVVDPATGKLTGGDPGGVKITSELLGGSAPAGLATILGLSDRREQVTYRIGGEGPRVDAGRTDEHGYTPITLDELNSTPLKGVDPKRGGLLKVELTAEGKRSEQRILALPKDYDGPIFVSDIDDTLRATQLGDIVAGEKQAPIPGAKELLDQVSKRGVPIIYLSAGSTRIGPLNDDFLTQMPEGVLLARAKLGLEDLNPSNGAQAKRQGEYKAARLQEIRAAYPRAKIFGLGDDKYGDAMAYAKAGAAAYIHDVRPGDDNIPAGFTGTMTKDYDDAFRAKVLGDLDTAIGASESFK